MRRVLPILLLLAACSSTDIRLSIGTGFIEGQVTTAQGSPVPDALVVAAATRSPFGDVIAHDSTRTDAAGHYAITLTTSDIVDGDALLTLSVTPPLGLALEPASRSALAVAFSPTSEPTDTTRIAFALSYLPD